MTKYLYILIGVLYVSLCLTMQRVSNLRDDNRRLENNQSALMSDVEYYCTENGKNAATIDVLELKKSEVERNCADLVRTCDDLRIKVKRFENASTVGTVTEVKVETVVRDTVILSESAKAFRYSDPWFNVYGTITKDTARLDINCRDTLSIVVHREPRRFLFFRYGTKRIRCEAVNANPNSHIEYLFNIKMK